MRRITSIFVIVVAFFLVFVQMTMGKVAKFSPSPLPSPTPSTAPREINSFELFWPVTAGKTLGDSFYWLKILKEDIRGALIFGKAQKSDYQTFRVTKRIVEAEKLLNDGKNDLATSSLSAAFNLLGSVKSSWAEAKEKDEVVVAVKDNISKQLGNLKTFLTYLSPKYSGEVKVKIDQNNQRVQEIISSL